MFWVVCGLIGRYQRFRAEDGDSMFLGNVGTYLPTSLHGVTTQKNVAILTAVRTSYLTSLNELRIKNMPVLCEISSSHGGEHEVQNCLLGYTAV
jgi:hypothetical protein